MNIILSAIRNSPQLTRVWVRTGDARTPLACLWKEASACLAPASQSSPEDDIGRIGFAPRGSSNHASTRAGRTSRKATITGIPGRVFTSPSMSSLSTVWLRAVRTHLDFR
jgi:hypothetical protein